MKCPVCKGTGKTYRASVDLYSRCDECRGTGEIVRTNEEWLHTMNTEQLADVLSDFYLMGVSHGINGMDITQRANFVEWLKQPHKPFS